MIGISTLLLATFQIGVWTEGPRLPAPVANNAVAAVETPGGWEVFSFLGIDESRLWSGVHSRVFRYREGVGAWTELDPVPGPGRLAGTAQTMNGRIYLFGGYTVAEDGSERSVPEVDVYDPTTGGWGRASNIPVPTDDAVSGVWSTSTVFLVSGWHDTDNIPDVQGYDARRDRWFAATPIPGPPVFGHAGTVSGNTIVYIDGVRVDHDPRALVLEGSSWRGDIDPADPSRVSWRRLADHPGLAVYRAAAAAVGPWVVFAGGTNNPYNYDGVGYDGNPSEPLAGAFAYHVEDDRWVELPPLQTPTMDHRGIVVVGDELWIVGGMEGGQRVREQVTVAALNVLIDPGD